MVRVGDQAGIEEAALAPYRRRLAAAEHAAALGAGLLDLRLELWGSVGLRHRPERGRLFQRIARLQLLAHLGERALEEAIVDGGVHVDALDAAAALPGVVERAVDEVLDGVGEVGVGSHVRRILPAQLEADVDEARRGNRAIDLVASAHATREADVSDLGAGDHPGDDFVIGVDGLDEPLWSARLGESPFERLAAQSGAGGMLDEHGVPGEDRRNDDVDGDEQRIVPRADVEDDAHGLVPDESGEPGNGGERLVA